MPPTASALQLDELLFGPAPDRFEPAALAELPAGLPLGRLPAGRHSLPRSFVVQNQRLRIVAGMLRALTEHGYPAVTIGHITGEARISRAAFYKQFAGKEECFLATYDLAGDWLCARVERAVAEQEDWAKGIRAGVSEALDLLAANPALAHLIAVEAPQAGRAARDRQQAGIARFAAALRPGPHRRAEVPTDLEEMLLGGALMLIARYVDTGRVDRLPETTDELLDRLLIPYLGQGETSATLA